MIFSITLPGGWSRQRSSSASHGWIRIQSRAVFSALLSVKSLSSPRWRWSCPTGSSLVHSRRLLVGFSFLGKYPCRGRQGFMAVTSAISVHTQVDEYTQMRYLEPSFKFSVKIKAYRGGDREEELWPESQTSWLTPTSLPGATGKLAPDSITLQDLNRDKKIAFVKNLVIKWLLSSNSHK